MKVLRSLQDVKKENISGASLTIGSFDGVHLGHQHLVSRLKSLSKTSPASGPTVVITFDPHPARILSPHFVPRIFSQQDQIDMFSSLGIDYLYFLPFTKEMAELAPQEFAQQYIFDLFKPQLILLGYDFAFGKNRSGTFADLKKMAENLNGQAIQEQALLLDGQIVSSTAIREAIQNGDMLQAKKLLGRPFYLAGEVITGRRLGRTIGIPTANISLHSEIEPSHGVYFCKVEKHFAICNLGTNPTVTEDRRLKLECHLLDFDQDIYGQTLKVEFYQKIREEIKFPSIDVLKNQIQHDIAVVRRIVQGLDKT